MGCSVCVCVCMCVCMCVCFQLIYPIFLLRPFSNPTTVVSYYRRRARLVLVTRLKGLSLPRNGADLTSHIDLAVKPHKKKNTHTRTHKHIHSHNKKQKTTTTKKKKKKKV